MLHSPRVALLLTLGILLKPSRSAAEGKAMGYDVFPGENIQEAVDKAGLDPVNKVVKVHAGLYEPKAKGQALVWFHRGHNGVHLEAVGEVTLTAANAELSDPGSPAYPAVVNHVVYFGDGITGKTILQGFRIVGANHFVTAGPPEIEPSTSLNRNLFFYADGGAIKIFGNSSPTLRGLEIEDNYASPCAGGISVQQQAAPEGPELTPVRIENCLFRRNRSQITGAAVDLLPGSSAVISNCLFIANVANLGVNYISENKTQPEFTNSAPLTVFPTSRAVVQNCTFTGNRNGVEDLGRQSVYQKCIFWRNDRGGAFYGGERYDLHVEDEAEVSGCCFGGPVIDRRGVVSKLNNLFNAPDPKFDAHYKATGPDYETAGLRSVRIRANQASE
jgi:hypothetical protein